MKPPSAELRTETLRALLAVFGEKNFGAQDVLDTTAGDALKNPANAVLKDLIARFCVHRTPSMQRIGRRLRKHCMRLEVDGFRFVADHSGASWSYAFERLAAPGEFEAMLQSIKEQAERERDEFSLRLAGKSPSRALDAIDSHMRQQERAEKREQKEEERETAREIRKEYRREDRQLRAAETEYRKAAQASGAEPLPPGSFLRHISSGPDSFDLAMAAYREETERLKSAAGYERICAELTKGGREPSAGNVRTILEIERLRAGRHWESRMSFNVNDYIDFSTKRYAAQMIASLSASPTRPHWDPLH